MFCKALNILVVGHNEVNRDVAAMFLETEGHTIKTALNGLGALKILGKETFDCILMDIQMPKMNGMTATRCIRACEQKTMTLQSEQEHGELLKYLHKKLCGSYAPIIALTANVFQQDKQKHLKVGMDGFLGNPMRQQEILQALNILTCNTTTHPEKTNVPLQTKADLIEDRSVAGIKKCLQTTYALTSKQINKLFKSSVHCIQEDLEALAQAWEIEIKTELAESAHKLKGTLATLGLVELTQKAQQIQHAAEKNEDRDYEQIIGGIREELKHLLEGNHA